MLASASGDAVFAARIGGAAERSRLELGVQRSPHDELLRRRFAEQAKAALPIESFDAAERGGRDVAYADALVEAERWLAEHAGR